jgi:hypothetical protein
MLSTIANETDDPDAIRDLLQNHPVFLSLEPHLSTEARRAAYARSFTVAAGVALNNQGLMSANSSHRTTWVSPSKAVIRRPGDSR